MTLPFPHDVDGLQAGVTEPWKSFDLATMNGNAVAFRVMQDTAADWHVHESTDELFYVTSGTVFMDTDQGTREIRTGQLFVVPAGTQHRARMEGRATLLNMIRRTA